jgi:hypothetical protein
MVEPKRQLRKDIRLASMRNVNINIQRKRATLPQQQVARSHSHSNRMLVRMRYTCASMACGSVPANEGEVLSKFASDLLLCDATVDMRGCVRSA